MLQIQDFNYLYYFTMNSNVLHQSSMVPNVWSNINILYIYLELQPKKLLVETV